MAKEKETQSESARTYEPVLFKPSISTTVVGVVEGVAERRILGNSGREVTSARVRIDGSRGTIWCEILAWGDKEHTQALLMQRALSVPRLRVIGKGFPADDVYKEKVQHKVSLDELWAENRVEGRMVAVFSKNGAGAPDDEPLPALEVPPEAPFPF